MFHPERLTGRRARQYAKSISWRSKPPNTPKTLTELVRKPELIRAWGRVKTAGGHFHYVVLIRDRLVMASHLIDRRLANEMANNFDAIGGEGNTLRCEACERVFKTWTRVGGKHEFAGLPQDFQAAVQCRKPNINGDVVGLSRDEVKSPYSSGIEINTVERKPDPDGPVHPKPWVEPESTAIRWYKLRRENGRPESSLQKLLTNLAAKEIAPHIRPWLKAKFSVTDYSRKWEWSGYHRNITSHPYNAKDPSVVVKWTRGESDVVVRFRWNLFNWYLRAYRRGRVISDGRWLILVPGRTAGPDDPVLCDAVDVTSLPTYVREAKAAAKKKPDPGTTPAANAAKGEVNVPLTHGVLFKTADGWRFTPTFPESKNRVGEADQVVPDNRVGHHHTTP